MDKNNDVKKGISWKTTFSLITNKFILGDFLFVSFTAVAGFQLLFIIANFFINGEALEAVFPLYVLGIAFFALFFLMFFASLLLGNKYNAEFTVDENGISYRSGRKETMINRILLVLFLLFRPTRSGSAILAISNESGALSWKEIYKAKFYDKERVIAVYNSWRVWTRLYCTPENYAEVVEFIKSHLKIGEELRKRSDGK